MEYLDFKEGPLELDADPIAEFEKWIQFAKDQQFPEPTAMSLATLGLDGYPRNRIVLYRGLVLNAFGEKSLGFYTNYESDKSQELEATKKAAIVFHWTTLRRQLRVVGDIAKTSSEQSDKYFATRERGSQIGAWSSPQSHVLKSRSELEKIVREKEMKFNDMKVIPRPQHWGGWALTPKEIEFWEERPHRLHARLKYIKEDGDGWIQQVLAP